MSAYATARRGRTLTPIGIASSPISAESSMLDAVINDLAERVAAAVVAQLDKTQERDVGEWLDSQQAADYLGIHRDTLRKLAAERTIPAHQDKPGCKLFFRRSDLDEWRRSGGRVVRVASVLAEAA
jgi:excisionase family DNA binding protein